MEHATCHLNFLRIQTRLKARVYTENMGLINKRGYGMFVACGIWCLADVSSVSFSSEKTVYGKYERRVEYSMVSHSKALDMCN